MTAFLLVLASAAAILAFWSWAAPRFDRRFSQTHRQAEAEWVDFRTDLDALADEADFYAKSIPVGGVWP